MKILSLEKHFLEEQLVKNGIDCVSFQFGRRKDDLRRYKEFKQILCEFKPDVLFFWKHPHLSGDVLKKAKELVPKMKIVMWYGDQRGYIIPPLVKKRLGFLDALLITNEDEKQKKIYRKAGIPNIFTFYHAFSTDEFRPLRRKSPYELFFGGTNFNPKKFPLSRFRNELVMAIHDNFKLIVRGGGWPFQTKKWVFRPNYCEAIHAAQINLGINHYNIFRYYNRRLFEGVASGKLHLTYYIPGMEKHFVNKKHLVWFKSVDECLRLITYYLKNPEKREQIAKTGRDFFVENHTWYSRTKQFIKKMEKLL